MIVIASSDFPMTLSVHIIDSSGPYDLCGESGDLTVMWDGGDVEYSEEPGSDLDGGRLLRGIWNED